MTSPSLFLQNGANDGTDGTFRQVDYASITGAPGPSTVIPSGTVMLFIQAAAPTGWTRVTTNDDALLRIVGSATPGTGGTNGFVAAFNSQTTTGSTTLTTAQIPAHTHPIEYATNCAGANYTASAGTTFSVQNTGTNTGGGGSHNHSITTAIKYVDALVASKN